MFSRGTTTEKRLRYEKIEKLKRWTPWLVGLAAFVYLASLATKQYSWVFTSSDSGSWLATAILWMTPAQMGGSPYLLLSHLVNLLFPNHLPAAMTILLSALPSAITVALTYLITLRLTQKVSIALVCSIVLISSTIFLIESTVTIYRALAIMFLTAALYTYTYNKRYLTTALLGLSAGTHVMIFPIAALWLLADQRLRYWLKPVLLFIAITGLCYSLTLLLMYLPTPRFQSGGFNLNSVRDYFTKTSQAIVGEISIFETPARLLLTVKLLLLSFGAALIPVWYTFRKPFTHTTLILFATILFTLWYFVTCMDVTTWTYLAFLSPSTIILAGVGLSRLPAFHLKTVLVYSIVPLVLSPIFLNADILTKQNPTAQMYLTQLQALPQDCIVVTNVGGLSLGLYYYIASTNSHIMPLAYPSLDSSRVFPTEDYIAYLRSHYYASLDYTGTLNAIQSALDQNILVYYTDYYDHPNSALQRCFNLQGSGSSNIKRVVSLTGLLPKPQVELK